MDFEDEEKAKMNENKFDVRIARERNERYIRIDIIIISGFFYRLNEQIHISTPLMIIIGFD